MKKNFTILSAIFITLFSLNAKAQDDKTYAKSYLTLLGGVSAPYSDFGSTNYYNNNAGFAKRGAVIGLDAGIYVYKNLAVGINFSFEDQGELTYNDAVNLAAGYNASFSRNITTVSSTNRFHSLNVMAGPQYSILYRKFTFDLRASVGLIKSLSTPAISVNFDNSTKPADNFYQLSSTATSFAYGGSAGLRYSLGDSWDVGLKFNYIDCQGINIGNSGNSGAEGRFQTKLPITVFQSTLGITLKF